MKFKFAEYTEITELYKKHSTSLVDGDGYIRFFVCPDVWDIWLVRVIEGLNIDYEEEEGTYLLERNKIPKMDRSDDLTTSGVIKIIEEDDFSSWDVEEYTDLESIIWALDIYE